jgi:hypothetical protein
MILHLSQIFLTDALTFIFSPDKAAYESFSLGARNGHSSIRAESSATGLVSLAVEQG